MGQKILKKFPQQYDSTIIFDFVDLKKFKELLTYADYRDKFYSIFKLEKYIVNGYSDAGLPIFKEFYLGTSSVFESDIQLALKNDKTLDQSRDKLSKEIDLKNISYKNAYASVWDNEKVKSFLLTTILILVIILYPIRLCFLLIKWAIKTLK